MGEGGLRAIDLYSGVGGWSLGLALAGIEVVASYERSAAANRTNLLNNGHVTHTVDIRTLTLDDLPSGIDVVVGSPPCTEFSFSNRGGGGNIKDGLRDIIKFLTIVDHLKPRWWVMENVPRVAGIIEKELGKRGRLARFRHLGMKTVVLNMEEYGLPQRRKRCLVGNLDFDLLHSYTSALPAKTLGDVVNALEGEVVEDPLFGVSLRREQLVDHEAEPYLNTEERRINEAGKLAHPVYNAMPFPDPLDRSVRTITATCTRVSRESVIIEEPSRKGAYRRLTVRERACLQGFPITYQFFGASYGAKLRMIGNAIPPAFSYYVGHAIQGAAPGDFPALREKARALVAPTERPQITKPDSNGRRFPPNRTFRFAVPNLRLKSGVRFEMVNVPEDDQIGWAVRFYFGTSKDICDITLDHALNARLRSRLPSAVVRKVESELDRLTAFLAGCDMRRMQAVWSHSGPGGTRPFDVLDQLGASGAAITGILGRGAASVSEAAVNDALTEQYGREVSTLPGVPKLIRNAHLIHAGLLVGSTANLAFSRQLVGDSAAPRRVAR